MTLHRRLEQLERRIPASAATTVDDDRPVLAASDLCGPIARLLGRPAGYGSAREDGVLERAERHAAELRRRDPERLGQIRALDLFVAMLVDWVRDEPRRAPSVAAALADIREWGGADGIAVADALAPLLDPGDAALLR